MPIKDPEKKREAQKRADAKRAGKRHPNWTAVVYPESAPKNWRDLLDEHHFEWAESPLHDKDENPDGTPKKPHWHIAMKFDSVKTYEQVMELLKPINAPSVKYVQSMKGLIRYFTHMDNPEKAQYKQEDIRTHGGFDLSALLSPTATEVNAIIGDMADFVVKYRIREFAVLFMYARHDRPDWFEVLNTHCYSIREFMKSLRFMKPDTVFANPVTGEIYDLEKEEQEKA